jgi:hypothetical protein
MTEPGVYLYCLARPAALSRVLGLAGQGVVGVDGPGAVIGLSNVSGVVGVVSEIDIAEFSEQNMQSLPWIAERAERHEMVVGRVMAASPVLPVKFGTVFRSRTSLLEFLDRHSSAIENGLLCLQGKAEWSVKGFLVEARARQIIAAEDEAIVTRRAALSSSPGLRYLQQKQLDRSLENALEEGLARVASALQLALAPHALASCALRCHSSLVTGRVERQVFSASYLLRPDMLDEFRSSVSEQQQAHDMMGLSLELLGPWPPYNFCPDLTGTAS